MPLGLVWEREPAPPTADVTGAKAGYGFALATIAPACLADFGSAGGAFKPHGVLDNNDLVAFITAFFTRDPLADGGSAGAAPLPDCEFDNNDFVVFVNNFFEQAGCL